MGFFFFPPGFPTLSYTLLAERHDQIVSGIDVGGVYGHSARYRVRAWYEEMHNFQDSSPFYFLQGISSGSMVFGWTFDLFIGHVHVSKPCTGT
jgi:hypothetical protein